MRANIVNGPEKFDLVSSLLAPTLKKFVTFTARATFSSETFTVDVAIDMIEKEDGSGDNFNFEGRARNGTHVNGYFNTFRRTGTLATPTSEVVWREMRS